MPLYFKTESFASIINNFNYSLKHTSNLNNPAEVERRIKVLEFWNKHGLAAAIDYSNRSRATLYNWKKALEDSRSLDKRMGRAGLKSLDPRSRRPKHCKQAKWNKKVIDLIITYASKYPNMGRQQCHQLVKRHLIKELNLPLLAPSESTVGRILKHLRNTGKLPSKDKLSYNAKTGKLYVRFKKKIKKLRRADLPFKVTKPGDLIQIDGIDSYFMGKHYYILNCIDYVSEVAHSYLLPNKSSVATANILKQLPELYGYTIKAIQTDNGSEFTSRFHEAAEQMNIKHCFNYVKKPIYNGKVERFNRTIQEAIFDEDFLINIVDNPKLAQKRINNFIYFYNYDRPHKTIKWQTPMEYLLQWIHSTETTAV